jgi:hypothetical protein
MEQQHRSASTRTHWNLGTFTDLQPNSNKFTISHSCTKAKTYLRGDNALATDRASAQQKAEAGHQ